MYQVNFLNCLKKKLIFKLKIVENLATKLIAA